jgi:hypothetical protein
MPQTEVSYERTVVRTTDSTEESARGRGFFIIPCYFPLLLPYPLNTELDRFQIPFFHTNQLRVVVNNPQRTNKNPFSISISFEKFILIEREDNKNKPQLGKTA